MTTGSEVLADGLTFPEGVRWHDGAVWFSDMHDHRALRLAPGEEPRTVAAVPECPSGLGFLPDGSLLVVEITQRRLVRMTGGTIEPYADLRAFSGDFANDMVVDRHGRAYVGMRSAQLRAGGPIPAAADAPDVVVLVDASGNTRVAADGLVAPNGTVITPDGRTLVVAETFDPGGASMKGMNLSGKPGMVQPMQMPPTFGQPPMPAIQPRLGTLQLTTGPQQPSLTWHFGEL